MGKNNIERIDFFKNKFNENKSGDKGNYGKLLKRKRLEDKLTLEEVSKGVCSTSYLSRIENNLVDVDEEFLGPLFEKLDINYNDVKISSKVDIYTNILKYYLKEEFNEVNSFIADCIESKIYSDIEIKLLVMFMDIINKNYDEVELIMDDVDQVLASLLDDEVLFYCFNICLFYFKTNQYFELYNSGCVFYNSLTKNSIFNESKCDLLMNIFSFLDDDYRFNNLLCEYKNIVFKYSSNNRQLRHFIEETYIDGKYNQIIANYNFNKIETELLDYKDKEMTDYYNRFKALHYLSINNNYKAYTVYSNTIINQYDSLLFNIILLKQKNYSNWIKHLNNFKIIEFSNYNKLANKINEYFVNKIERVNENILCDFLKKYVVLDNINHYLYKNSNIFKVIYDEYMKLLYETGKYKEISKVILAI